MLLTDLHLLHCIAPSVAQNGLLLNGIIREADSKNKHCGKSWSYKANLQVVIVAHIITPWARANPG